MLGLLHERGFKTMKKPWSLVRPAIARLNPNSTVDEILAVLVYVHKLEHWFDRKRGIILIARCLEIELGHVERLAAEVRYV